MVSKKLFVLAGVVLPCLGTVSAKVVSDNTIFVDREHYIYFMPSALSSDGKTKFYYNEYSEGNLSGIVVLNSDFTVSKRITPKLAGPFKSGGVTDRYDSYEDEWTSYGSTYDEYIDPASFDYKDNLTTASGIVSQNIFNSDDHYEYILLNAISRKKTNQSDNDGDGKIDEISTNYEISVTGFSVYNDEGAALQSVNLPEELEQAYLAIYRTENRSYLFVDGRIEEKGVTMVYEITNGTGAISYVNTLEGRMAVSPIVSSHNTPITITLDNDGKDFTEVDIIDTLGRLTKKIPVSGNGKITLDTDRMAKGVYVVVGKGKGADKETCKIIIR